MIRKAGAVIVTSLRVDRVETFPAASVLRAAIVHQPGVKATCASYRASDGVATFVIACSAESSGVIVSVTAPSSPLADPVTFTPITVVDDARVIVTSGATESSTTTSVCVFLLPAASTCTTVTVWVPVVRDGEGWYR